MAAKTKKKRGNIFLKVIISMIMATFIGFGVGFFYFAPKLTGNHVSIKVTTNGIRLLSPEEMAGSKAAGFSDVWEKGVSPKDIPALKGDERKKNDEEKADDEGIQIEPPIGDLTDRANDGEASGSITPVAPPANPTGNDTNYTTNSRQRDE